MPPAATNLDVDAGLKVLDADYRPCNQNMSMCLESIPRYDEVIRGWRWFTSYNLDALNLNLQVIEHLVSMITYTFRAKP